MTLKEFQDKYNGRYLDFDGKFGCQCMDLMRSYIKEVLDINPYTLPPATYAKQVFTNFKPNKNFKKVVNGPQNAPQKGDIVFWGTYLGVTGIAGHVAVCDSANSMSLITFDQNWPTGTPCHFQKHSYKGVLGWLTPVK